MKADILAFGVHPDDVEVACGGTLIAAVEEGKTVVVVDITRGELGTRGCGQTRLSEAAAAAKIMGLSARKNLFLEDAFFQVNKETICKVIAVIRRYRPEIILCNAPDDRHPDHGRAAKLVSEASFLSGLSKIETLHDGIHQSQWRPAFVFNYIQHVFIQPDFVLDISGQIEKKLDAVLAYKTQFNCDPLDEEPETYISEPSFMNTIKGRAELLGMQIGVRYAEGFISHKTIGIKSFDAIVQKVT